MSTKHKIDLSLLNRLVAELNTSLKASETIPASEGNLETIMELSRAAGILGILVQEGSLLIKDVYALVQNQQAMAAGLSDDPLGDLNQLLKSSNLPKRGSN